MPAAVLNLTEKEKAIFYMNYQTRLYYVNFTILGAGMAILVLFGGSPNFTLLFTPFIGFLFAYSDIHWNLYLLTHKPNVYTQGFEWKKLVWWSRSPYRNLFSLKDSEKIKLFSQAWLKLYIKQIRFFILYESYKWFTLFFLGVVAFFTSWQNAYAVMFNWGLNIFFWGIFYLFLWNKKYFWKAAKALKVPEEKVIEIKNTFKK